MAPPRNSESEPSSRSSNSPILRFAFLTLFPEVFPGVLSSSLLGKAQSRGLVSFDTLQIRDFATDKHRTVDDTPYGGGEGMVMKADVLRDAWLAAKKHLGERSRTVFMSPQGRLLDQELARELSGEGSLIVVCGHYEGVDERFIDACVDDEISMGDYVLTGGELPALVLADAVTRLIPGVVGNERSLTEESLESGLLKYPQYTRPRDFDGHLVPEILLSGDHAAIKRWRAAQMRERTERKRPDLWMKYNSRLK